MLKLEAKQWQARSKSYLEGLSNLIDQQLTVWSLHPAEREVEFLLLKGLSLKDIAMLRETTEKTSRVQAMAIYAKAGLAGRSELSAFFKTVSAHFSADWQVGSKSPEFFKA